MADFAKERSGSLEAYAEQTIKASSQLDAQAIWKDRDEF